MIRQFQKTLKMRSWIGENLLLLVLPLASSFTLLPSFYHHVSGIIVTVFIAIVIIVIVFIAIVDIFVIVVIVIVISCSLSNLYLPSYFQ